MLRRAKRNSAKVDQQDNLIAAFDREAARTLAARIAEKNRLAFAQTFASEVLRIYCRTWGYTIEALQSLDFEQVALSSEASEIAERFGLAIGRQALREAGSAVGAIYTAALPESYRAMHGIFYTPAALVDGLIEMAEDAEIDWRSAHILDPACGGGAFLLAAADKMISAMADTNPAFISRQINARLHGYDVDAFGAWLARALIEMRLHGLVGHSRDQNLSIVQRRDSLEISGRDLAAYDLVIGNPPYGRVSLAAERRTCFARSVYGHANLYGLFTDVALRYVKSGGVVAYVTPPSMLSGLYYKALRTLLATEAPPLAVNFVAERDGVFADVLQETMLATYRRGGIARGGRVGFVATGTTSSRRFIPGGTIALPAKRSAPWLLPRSPRQVNLTRRLREMPHRLSDFGYAVSTGPLVWNRYKNQFRQNQSVATYPVIWAESVGGDGRFEWKSEKRNHAPWFAAASDDGWMVTDRCCVLVQRTTAKEQSRRLIAAELPNGFVRKHGGVMVENHLNMVRPTVAKPRVLPGVIAALLNSAAVDEAFRCINGSVAVSAFELEELPLPSPAVMTKLINFVKAKAPPEKIEKLIAAAYRVSDVPATA